MPPHPLPNFEIQKHCQNDYKFNGAYSRNNLSEMNLDEYESIGTHWIALYVKAKNVTYFDSFGVEDIPKETKEFKGNKNNL